MGETKSIEGKGEKISVGYESFVDFQKVIPSTGRLMNL